MIDPDFQPGETFDDQMRRTSGDDDLLASMRVVVVEPNGARRVELVPRLMTLQLHKMQHLVGGFIEAVRLDMNPPIIMWCNEDGHALGLEPNAFATLIAVAYTPIVLGAVVLSGDSDSNGDMTSLDKHWIDQLVPDYYDAEENNA